MRMLGSATIAITAMLGLGAIAQSQVRRTQVADSDSRMLADDSDGNNWAAYGRTFGEQHFSPLRHVNSRNVGKLGLAWSMELERGNSATIPLEIKGVIYFANGYSVVHAVDALSGRLLWTYDPKVAEVAGDRLRQGWGSRGIGYWNGKIYTGTGDGRLIAVDARSGKPIWSVSTVEPGDLRYITGAPRLFDGEVIIGHGGGDSAPIRGYVTAYDAETGKQRWRFYTVPGNPAAGFEDDAQKMAATTWAGEWWKYGGGGNVWNAFTYDAESDSILLGTGNGAPWNRRVRSADRGDNLFLCSIVALDAKTGKYKWHYQINPGESWDYNASMDMHLADLAIDGHPRKVVLIAPKNGFFYVIDRTDGKLISAEKIAKVSWATKIDIASGRPVEVPDARYPDGKTFRLWPSMQGAHSWMPSAFSPETRLAYIPVNELAADYNDRGITAANWKRTPHNGYDMATNFNTVIEDPLEGTSFLLAWNPVTQHEAWRIPTPSVWNGGVLATGGNLVFQGQVDGAVNAYAADSGKKLWSYAVGSAVVAAPITYSIAGNQYLTVISGMGGSGAIMGKVIGRTIDYRTQRRRLMTFVLDGTGTLPAVEPAKIEPAADPGFTPDQSLGNQGVETFGRSCITCHGVSAIAGGAAPDLRSSSIPQSAEAFAHVVRDGALLSQGMPRFAEFTDERLEALREYIREQAATWRHSLGEP